ncbi:MULTISPECIES: Stp1/IreP family PP2C-type Ser/Thr phosphatase [Bacillus]|uniref:Stp1/IreP family PP2C-type Ser/Thr phosphatase n=1 Tax=Bacillus TaxID=1386 RepID=UPI0002F52164|nr:MULTISPECIES: Stp1/IreP family PP2C-type Ser/Thr phosphatase [Bacillus]
MKAVFRTDRGKVRQHNEDNGGIFHNETGFLAIVADGMGGHRAGEVASSMTLSYFKESWSQVKGDFTAENAENWLQENIQKVNQLLFKHAESHLECKGMGTTLVAALCTERFITIANIGDSRCYIKNESGFKQLTEDHSLVNELVRTGQISREDAEHHPRKNVLLRALGTEPNVEMDIVTIVFEEGDFLLLCSDGLSNKLNSEEMLKIIEEDETLEQKADHFINIANNHGGEDNITLVLLQYSFESEGR